MDQLPAGNSEFLRKTEHRRDAHLWLPRATPERDGYMPAADKALLEKLRELLPQIEALLARGAAEAPDVAQQLKRHARSPHGSGRVDFWGSYTAGSVTATGYITITIGGTTYHVLVEKP